jgi:hypothetical protein
MRMVRFLHLASVEHTVPPNGTAQRQKENINPSVPWPKSTLEAHKDVINFRRGQPQVSKSNGGGGLGPGRQPRVRAGVLERDPWAFAQRKSSARSGRSVSHLVRPQKDRHKCPRFESSLAATPPFVFHNHFLHFKQYLAGSLSRDVISPHCASPASKTGRLPLAFDHSKISYDRVVTTRSRSRWW